MIYMQHTNVSTRRGFLITGIALIATTAAVPLATRAQRVATKATPGASPEAPPAATPLAEVTVGFTMDFRFDPEDLVITPGTTVRWANESPMPHTATGDPAKNPLLDSTPEYVILPDGAEPWASDLLQPGDSYAHTFETTGTYHYICIPHIMSGMRATITVEE